MLNTDLPIRYCFDRFELQPGERRLLVGGAPTALGPRAFDLLVALVERAGQLVSKESLLERVWPKLVVEENNLQVQISALRKLLGQDAIATVAGQGYRFTRKLLTDMTRSQASMAQEEQESQDSFSHRQHNLPRNNNPLVGRATELAQLQQLMQQQALVTVTGAGGVGKTRLMLEVAQSLLSRFADGVWLTELAAITDPATLPCALFCTLGGQVTDGNMARQALLRRLRGKSMLLLLDNCEHLLEAVAELVQEILDVAPQVQVLTTSQEVLGLAAEYVFRLPSLSLPRSIEPDVGEALASDAVSLFVERAKAVGWAMYCDDDNAPVIAAICRRLDGIPLAIEMAAARVPMLGLDGLAQLLDERFHVLTMGRRGALPRHRTLHATLDWSYGLLSQPERVVFRRIGYFVGGFTLAAAIAVAADAELDQFEVINCITSLVAKSLLVADVGNAHARYRLLESTRAYAQEKLAEAGETAQVARLAALHYQWVFKPCFDDWTRLSDTAFDARYAPELDNLRQAMDWAFGQAGDVEVGLDLAGCSGQVWCSRSLMSEARQRIDIALERVTATTPLSVQVELWLAATMIFYWRRSDRVVPIAQQAVMLARDLGDSLRLGYVLMLQAAGLALRGDSGPEALLQQAQPLLIASKRTRLLAQLHKAWGMLAVMGGNTQRSISEYRIALELSTAAGADLQILNAQENLADALWLAGDLDGALEAAHGVVIRGQNAGYASKVSWGWFLSNLFGILVERGQPQDLEQAIIHGRAAMPYMYESECIWIALDHYSLRLAKLGQFDGACQLLGWTDAVYHGRNLKRQPNERRAMERTRELLHEYAAQGAAEAAQVAEWLAQGALLSDEEVMQVALKS